MKGRQRLTFFEAAAPIHRPPGAAEHSEATTDFTSRGHISQKESLRTTSRPTTSEEAKNFRSHFRYFKCFSPCLPLVLHVLVKRKIFGKPLCINNCKTINNARYKGHSSLTGSEKVATCRANIALRLQLEGGNTECTGVE